MKDINSFLSEKLELKKDLINKTEKMQEFKFYDRMSENNDYLFSVNVDISKPYVVYRDMYHSNLKHIAHIGDMLLMLGIWAEDFENFDPKNMIYFQTDDLDELKDFVKHDYDSKKYYDGSEFVKDLIDGNISDLDDGEFNGIKTQKDLDDFMDDYL